VSCGFVDYQKRGLVRYEAPLVVERKCVLLGDHLCHLRPNLLECVEILLLIGRCQVVGNLVYQFQKVVIYQVAVFLQDALCSCWIVRFKELI